MSETAPISGPAEPETPTANDSAGRIAWTILIVAALFVCYFSQLGVLGFLGPDEPRYAWIARAMTESRDWATPRLYGQPWFEKPVLYYWGAAASFKMFGVSEAAARLPSALCALLGTLALAWLAWRVYGAATARWLLILLPTSVGMIGFSHSAATDMPFAGMLTVAMVCAAVVLGLARDEHTPILPRTPWLGLLLFGGFLGLAVLAKGPAAIILCGGAVFFWVVFTKRWRDALRLLHPAAIAAFCAAALPWYVLCARRNSDFFRVFIIEHNFKRYLTPEFQHVQPFWFYVPVVLVAFLPWTGTLVWAVAIGVREYLRTRALHDATWFFVCWAGFCVLFFSTSHSKLPGYVLPAFPAMGLLLARSVASVVHAGQPLSKDGTTDASSGARSFRWVHAAVALLFFVLCGTAAYLARTPQTFAGRARVLGMAFVLFGLANLILAVLGTVSAFRRDGVASESDAQEISGARGAARELLAAFAGVPVLVALTMAPRLAQDAFPVDPSGREISRELQKQRIAGNQLFVAGMNRSMRYGVSFYLHDEVREWGAGTETGGYLLTGTAGCERVVGAGFYCEEQAFDAGHKTGRFLYLVIPKAGARR